MISSNVEKLRSILREHEEKTLPAMHRLPRIQLCGKSETDQHHSGLPRTFMSSYNSGWDPLTEAEKSILVSKVPVSSTRPHSTALKKGQLSEKGHVNKMSSSSQVSPGVDSTSSTSTIDIIEEETKTTTSKTTTRTSTAFGNNANTSVNSRFLNDDHTLKILLSVSNNDDLEDTIRSLRPSQLSTACRQLVDHIRKSEQHTDLREELLRRSQSKIDALEVAIQERDTKIRCLEENLLRVQADDDESDDGKEKISGQMTKDDLSDVAATLKCRFNNFGCPYRLPSMEDHEERECRYRPTRCPSLTCSSKPPFSKLLQHIEDEHGGTKKGRDRICRNRTNHLISSYVNIDKEPIFYKNARMTWVANELVVDGEHHFFLECMRIPPDWHIWVYYLGGETQAEKFQVTITLFREDEYGKMDDNKIFSAQRSYTGKVISIHRSKEEIAENGLGFMVHDKQIRPLCGKITDGEEQLFGYEVTVYTRQS